MLGIDIFILSFFFHFVLESMGTKFKARFINFLKKFESLIYLVVLFGSVFGLMKFITLFHERFLIPKNWSNIENLDCHIYKSEKTTDSKLLYFNDKYLFVELTKKSKKEIKHFKIEVLNSECN